MAATAPRTFTVIHVATGITPAPPASHSQAKASQASASKRTMLVLCALLYTSASLGYSLLTTRSKPSVSDPQLWTVLVCLPCVVIMIRRLLTIVRSMEDSDAAPVTSRLGQDLESQEWDHECAFGSDMIAIVGDVCVYVVVLLLLCYALLPRQVRAGEIL